MEIFTKPIGGRMFLIVGTDAIPMDRIKRVDLHAANGGASDNSVQIVTDDPEEDYFYAFANADIVRAFFTKKDNDENSPPDSECDCIGLASCTRCR